MEEKSAPNPRGYLQTARNRQAQGRVYIVRIRLKRSTYQLGPARFATDCALTDIVCMCSCVMVSWHLILQFCNVQVESIPLPLLTTSHNSVSNMQPNQCIVYYTCKWPTSTTHIPSALEYNLLHVGDSPHSTHLWCTKLTIILIGVFTDRFSLQYITDNYSNTSSTCLTACCEQFLIRCFQSVLIFPPPQNSSPADKSNFKITNRECCAHWYGSKPFIIPYLWLWLVN